MHGCGFAEMMLERSPHQEPDALHSPAAAQEREPGAPGRAAVFDTQTPRTGYGAQHPDQHTATSNPSNEVIRACLLNVLCTHKV